MNNNTFSKILGIDWGEKKIGLAFSDNGVLAEPYGKVKKASEVGGIVKKEKIDKIVVGVSEGKSEKTAREFGMGLSKELNVPVEFQDETLSSLDAQRFSIESGMKRKKRKGMEDAYAAAIMLQNYLDSAKSE